ncbi:hypothetical protein QCA50_008103 [Cerrena zonata]|uniref:Uncharacterized protein n=1 Tax=Cerrena zonata TaxID=2478898 RepID=A0AAW0GBN7_9APHY
MAIAKYAAKFKGENLLFLSIAPGLVATDAAPTMDGIDDEFTRLLQRIKAVAPQWNGIPLTPKQSVTAMLTTISKLTAKDSGMFLSHNGDNENWW